MEAEDKQSLTNSERVRVLMNRLFMAILCGVVLGFLEFFLGHLFAEIHIRTTVFFWLLYIISTSIISLLLSIFLPPRYDYDREVRYNTAFLLATAFLLSFAYLNFKTINELAFFSLRSVLMNLVLVCFFVGFARMLWFSKNVRKICANSTGFLALFSGAVVLLTYANFFYFNWPAAPQSIFTILTVAFLTASFPLISSYALVFSGKGSVGNSNLLRLGIVLVLVFGAPYLIGYPSLFGYRSRPAVTGVTTAQQPNIIWIVMDTVRRDRMSLYGSERETTPNLNRFANDAVVFENAYSTAPWTVPSHASMFTAKFPTEHGAHHIDADRFCRPLPEESLTISEILQEHGYKTCAISGNSGALNRENGFAQGFEWYIAESSVFNKLFWGPVLREIYPPIRNVGFLHINKFKLSSEVNQTVFHWLDQNSRDPFFLFINYMDVHSGYTFLPQEFDKKFGFDWDEWNRVYASIPRKDIVSFQDTLDQRALQCQYDQIDWKLNFLDENLGRLFDKLKGMNLFEESMIVVTSDHGHLYGEHHTFGHSAELYNELIHVPLVIKYPARAGRIGEVSNRLVQNIDIMPEILHYLGIELPADIQGQPIAETDHPVVAEVFRQKNTYLSELYPKRFYQDFRTIFSKNGEFKYIYSTDGEHELYNVAQDPEEMTNIAQDSSHIVQELQNDLIDWQDNIIPFKGDELPLTDSQTIRDKLKTLGYIK